MYECESCEHHYDPIECRWQCPRCHQKGNCCEGAPLPPVGNWLIKDNYFKTSGNQCLKFDEKGQTP